jgi:lysophospholipase L1-like esterase
MGTGRRWRVIAAMLACISCAAADSSVRAAALDAKKPEGKILKSDSARERSREKKKAVVIGASYARGWTDDAWGKFAIVNKGVDGERSTEMLARFGRDVLEERPDVVIIWGFINDIFRSSREGIDPTLEDTRRNIVKMVDLAKVNGIKPVLATEVTIRGRSGLKETIASWLGRIKGGESYQDYVNRHVLRTNQWIREYALEQKVQLLDFQPLLADGEGRRKPEYAKEDGSHLSAPAYKRLSQYAGEILGR